MHPSAVLKELRSRGFTVEVGPGRSLLVSPGSRLTDRDNNIITQHKAALLRLLEGPSDQVIDAMAIYPVDWSRGPVQMVQCEVVTLPGCPPVAMPVGRFDQLLAAVVAWNEAARAYREGKNTNAARVARTRRQDGSAATPREDNSPTLGWPEVA